MKSINLIIKNLRLLIRSKSSALVVLFAPLLIVLIIGIGFADFEEAGLNIGIYNPDDSELTNRFIRNLNSTDNNLINFNSPSECIRGIQEGVVLACVSFPEGFSLGDTRQELDFYVDESRLNLVYRLISSLSASVDTEQTEISQEITSELLQIIDRSGEEFSQSISDIVSLRARASSISSGVSSAVSDVSGLDVSVSVGNYARLEGDLEDLTAEYSSISIRAKDVIESGEELLNVTSDSTEKQNFESSLNSLKGDVSRRNGTLDDFETFSDRLENFISDYADLRSAIQQAGDVADDVQQSLNQVSSQVTTLNTDLNSLRVRHELLLEDIDNLQYRSAETIAQPFTTNIQTVTANLGRLTYSFPYLLMLVIMFIGIMLSSTLVFMEKDSRAFFRNFTTPTRQIFFTSMNYFTSLIIILTQVFVIMFVAYFLLDIPMLENWDVTLLVIFLASTMFILLGMVIGNLFNTNEAITMSNIFLGSIFMFLSNLILPLETLNETIQKIASYNPFVISAETMRGALLFEFDIVTLLPNIILMTSISILLFLFILMFQNVTGSYYLHKLKQRNQKIVLPEDNYLRLEDKKIVIKNLKDLHDAIEKLSEEDYKNYTKPSNIFSDWIEKSLKQRYLSYRIRKKGKDKALKILKKHLKKKKNRP